MQMLETFIRQMNKEEIRAFKLYQKRMQYTGERKDIALFDMIRKAKPEKNADNLIFEQLYGGKDKNSYYRLKNRLLEDAGKSLVLQHINKTDTLTTFHFISLSILFSNKNNGKLAVFYLKKAEKKAVYEEQYELLEIIYKQFIKLAQEDVSIDPVHYISKRKANRELLNKISEIDDLLALTGHKIKVSQNFSPADEPVYQQLKEKVNEFANDSNLQKSKLLQLRVYRAASQILLKQHDYPALEKYLLTTFEQFNAKKIFDKSNHDTKLQMLVYIVNALFKNKKYNKSLAYADKLLEEMKRFDNLHYNKYLFFYYNSLIINYSELDKDKAIQLLEELKTLDIAKSSSFYEQFIYANLAVLWFDKQAYDLAIKNIIKLQTHKNYKDIDPNFRMKIAVAELIIRFESGDADIFDYKLNQVKKDFKQLLGKEENNREMQLIKLMRKFTSHYAPFKEQKVIQQIKLFLSENPLPEREDTEIIKYNDWLKSKIESNLKT